VSDPQPLPDPLQQLCKIIIEQLQLRPQAEVTQLVTHLWTAIEAYPGLVGALQEDSRLIQINQGNSRGYQTWVAEGGIANIGEHYHVDTDKLKAVLEGFLRPPAVGIPQNLPRSGVVQFVGRETELERLHQHFQQNERLAITAVKGMGGIGKTELALQYCYHHHRQGTYSGGVCWLRAQEQDIGTQIVNFATAQLDLKPPEDLDLLTQLAYCWGHWREGDVLIVFDNVIQYQEIIPYLPPTETRFKVLLTTRKELGQSVQSFPIDVLDELQALELLNSLVRDGRIEQQADDAKALCRWLGYLPLGLELVGRYLARKPDLSLSEMLKRLLEQSLKSRALSKTEEGMTAPLGVQAAMDLSWQELDAQAQELACLFSLFAPAPVPWELVQACLPDRDSEELEDLRDEQLVKLSLLKRTGEGVYQVHQLLHEFFQEELNSSEGEEELKRAYCRVLVQEAQQIPPTLTRDAVERILPVIPHLAEAATTLHPWVEDENLFWPFVGLGRFYEGQGAYAQAQPWLEQCLAVCRERLGEEHPDVANSLNNLASLYGSQGKYEKAEPLSVQALELYKRLLGEEHPDVATSLNNLASLYHSQGKYEQAEPLYVKALELYKQLLGEEHPDVAISIDNLASLYKSQGQYEKAEPLSVQALELSKRLLGEEHPHVATSLNNLAGLYKSQGQYEKAEPLYVKALELSKRLLGEEHPYVAASLNNLAELYRNQGKYEQAEPLYVKALELYKRLLGEEHPHVATSLHNLAGLYKSQGQYEKAEPLSVQALELSKRLLGEEHPHVATSLNNLASLYHSQGKYEKAEPLYVKALEMRKRLLGEEHPHVATSLNNLASLYHSQGKYEKAEPLLVQALEMRKRLLGEEHPDVAQSLHNLASLYKSQGKYEKAEPLSVQALELSKRLLGEEHPHVATSLHNLAGLYHSQGEYEKAEPLYVKAVTILVRVLGPEHPSTITVQQNYTYCLNRNK
jgi:tetratricopeptide (TPR) repeat protein